MTIMSERIGQRLRSARLRAELRLEDIKGYSAGHLSRVERGLAAITPDIRRRYIDATGDGSLVDIPAEPHPSADSDRRPRSSRRPSPSTAWMSWFAFVPTAFR